MGFDKNIKLVRESQGMTQQEFGALFGVDRSAVAQWESGVSYPRMGKVVEIARRFHLSLDDLVADEQKPSDDLSRDERELLELYRTLDAEGREMALYALRGMVAAHRRAGDGPDVEEKLA